MGQYSLHCPPRQGEEGMVLIGLAQNRVREAFQAKAKQSFSLSAHSPGESRALLPLQTPPAQSQGSALAAATSAWKRGKKKERKFCLTGITSWCLQSPEAQFGGMLSPVVLSPTVLHFPSTSKVRTLALAAPSPLCFAADRTGLPRPD